MKTLLLLLPEVLIGVAALACLLERRVPLLRAAWLPAAAGAVVLLALGVELAAGGQVFTGLNGGFSQDRFALFAKAAILLTTLLIVLAADWSGIGVTALGLCLLAALGGMFAASATDLVVVWAGLQLAVLASVAALGLRDPVAARRLLPVLGALAALLALGLALVAAGAGTVVLSSMRTVLVGPVTLPLAIAVLLVLGALLGQLGLAPALGPLGPLATGAAGIAFLKFAGAAVGLAAAWTVFIPAVAALAMVAAALGAVAGGPARGILGWAGLLQLGWVVAGLAGGTRVALGASLFLFGAYLVASAAAPLALGDAPHGLAGLAERGGARAAAFAVCLLSLAGIPPLAGFFGEFAVAAQLARSGLFWLVAVGFFAGAVVGFAVLRDLRLVFLASSGEQVVRTPHGRLAMGGAGLAAVLVIAYTFFANPISGLAVQGAAAVGLR
ncbi:MAG TPA: proton-conducting transporter membrane subunit [Candidatus Dormibacteraeota bacterium]